MIRKTLAQFLAYSASEYGKRGRRIVSNQRQGQRYSNALLEFDKDAYDALCVAVETNHTLDPFYVDENIPAFLEFLDAYWHANGEKEQTQMPLP